MATLKNITDLLYNLNTLACNHPEEIEETSYDDWAFPVALFIIPDESPRFELQDNNFDSRTVAWSLDELAKKIKGIIKELESEIQAAPFRIDGHIVSVDLNEVHVGCKSMKIQDFNKLVEFVNTQRKKR